MDALAGKVALAIETSTRGGSIAWCLGDAEERATGSAALDPERSHGSDLMPAIDAAIGELGASPRDVGLVVVGRGPGSYTGLRVGAATALGIAKGTGAELVGVCSLEGLAHGRLTDGERAIVLRNAFGGQVVFAAYERAHEADVRTIVAPTSCAYEEVEERVAALDVHGPWLCDLHVSERLAESATLGETALRVAGDARATDLLALGRARRGQREASGPEAIKPLYVRPFEAKNRRR